MGHLQKEGIQPNLDTPKTILRRNSTYKLPQKPRSYQNLGPWRLEPQQDPKTH